MIVKGTKQLGSFKKAINLYVPKKSIGGGSNNLSASDPYGENVSLLLHMNGANGSTTFTDSSSNNLAVTKFGNAEIRTTQSRFGGSSAYFNGSENYLSQETMDYLSIPNNLATRLGTDPFTIEAWVYSTKSLQANSMGTIITQAVVDEGVGNNTGWFLSVYQGNVLFRPSNGGDFITTSLSNPIINRWAHVALVGNGSSIKLYVDGILEGQYNSSVNMNLALDVRPDTPTLIGAYETGILNQGSFRGYIDDLRITKGVARYTSNFTPPAAQFPDPVVPVIPQQDLALWLKADAGVTYDGSNNVSAWADQSATGNTPTLDSIGTGSPQYKANAINGKPCVFFNNTKSFIKENVNFSDWTVIHVSKLYNDPDGVGRIFSNRGAPNNILVGAWDNKDNRMYVGNQWISEGTNTNYTWKLSIGTCSITQNQSFFYQNGQQLAGPVSASQILNGFAIGGGWRDDYPERAICDIAEVIIYNRVLSENERQQIETYLNNKYNIFIPQQDLALWLKSDAGVITNGLNVTAWNDQSSNGLNFTSDIGAGSYPTLLINGINSKPSISFINSFMGTADTLVGSGSDMTIFVVGYSRGQSNGGGDLQSYINKSDLCSMPSDVFSFGAYGGPNTDFNFSAWAAVDNGNAQAVQKYPNAANIPRLLTMVNGGGALSLFINGSLHGTTAASITPQVLNKPIGIGNRSIRTSPSACPYFGSRENLNGVISEIIIYNRAVTTQERQQIEAYLNQKYAVY